MSEQQQNDKSKLHLADTKRLTFEGLLDLFRALTGREPTPQEVEKARRRWDSKPRPK